MAASAEEVGRKEMRKQERERREGTREKSVRRLRPVFLRLFIGLALAAYLLFAWRSLVLATPRAAPSTPQIRVVRGENLRPAVLLAPADGSPRALWTAPSPGHIASPEREGPRVRFTWVPTGAGTAACAAHIAIDLTTLHIFTDTSPACLPPAPPIQTAIRPPHPPSNEEETTSLPPPPFIRVYHDPRNTCRDAAPGQVDVIPFEEYVARVVPAEMPALWPMEALKAQAIAARTYAWYHILQRRPGWDVSDWSNYQVMCDERHPRSDAAAAATAGQALLFNGSPILAFYSAQNGHPTLDDPWDLPYIAPVPDPVSLGQRRSGHGLGLSQYGAKAWAERGWNAYQILAHYYPGTTLSVPPDAAQAVGTLLPPELENMTLGRGYPLFAFIGSPRPIQGVTVTAWIGDTPQVVLTRTGDISPFLGVWIPDPGLTSTKPITLTAMVADISGRVTSLGRAIVWRDLRPLTVTVKTVSETMDPRLPLTVSGQTPADVNVALGVSDGWLWEERAFSVSPPGAGKIVTDVLALDGWAWEHPRGAAPTILYGPYTAALEPGRSYRAWFRLRVDNTTSPDVVVFLDVVDDDGQTLLGMRALRGIEFPAPDTYREYPVDFHLFPNPDGRPHRVEFRVHATGNVTLAVDRVLVTTYPRGKSDGMRWLMPKRDGLHPLVAKAVTPSGVVAADAPLSVTLDMPARPVGFVPPAITGWITLPITLTWKITTAVSPPRPGTFAYRYAQQGEGWSEWHPLRAAALSTRTARLALPVAHLPEGRAVRVQVRGEDTFTYGGESRPITLALDVRPPTVTLLITPTANAMEWYTRPITVTVSARDAGAGILGVTVAATTTHTSFPTGRVSLAEPVPALTHTVTITREDVYTLAATARDGVGKETTKKVVLRLDTTPPQAYLVAPVWTGRRSVRIFWTPRDRDVVAYDVEVQRDGGTWTPWLEGVKFTSAPYVGEPGERVAFRVRAHDHAGWAGPWNISRPIHFPHLSFVAYVTTQRRP